MKNTATAYVLVNADVGKEKDVLKELKNVPSVKEAYFVYGVYDIVAKIETNDVRELKEVWRPSESNINHDRCLIKC